MTPEFQDRVIIVTGATGSIGAATVHHFLAAGATVVATDRHPAALNELAGSLGERCITVAADLLDGDAVTRILAAAQHAGGPHILVNNAGLTDTFGETLDATLDDWDHIFHVNLRSAFELSLCAARHWTARSMPGVIVNVTSAGAQRAHHNNAIYDAAKGGTDALTRALAVDLGPRGIRINAVAPAAVPQTGRPATGRPGQDLPLRCGGDPRDVAHAIAFLSSDAARFITGQILAVDGGLLAQLRSPTPPSPPEPGGSA